MDESKRWASAAASVGLTLRPTHYRFHREESFAHLERAVRMGSLEPPSIAHWMTGEWSIDGRSTEVIVLLDMESSGSWSQAYTHVIARVEPPKLLGLRMWKRPIELQRSGARTGDDGFDDEIVTSLLSPELGPVIGSQIGPPTHFRSHVRALLLARFEVHDSLIDQAFEMHVYDGRILSAALDNVARAALAFSMVDLPNALPMVNELRTVAESTGLLLEPQRHRLTGQLSRLPVTIAIEGRPAMISTIVECVFPQPIGLDLRLQKQGALQFIANLLGARDVIVGDRVFDDAFVVTGLAERDHLVRDFFGHRPLLRASLVALAEGADEFVFEDRRLFARWNRPLDDEAVKKLCDQLDAMGRSMIGASTQLPYR